MTPVANALHQLHVFREATSGVKALSRLSEPDFDNKVTAVEAAVRPVIKTVSDQAARRKLEDSLRKFKGAAGKVSLHMLERYDNPDWKIEGWSKYWIHLDAQTAELCRILEGLAGTSATSRARSAPWPVVVRLILPEDEADEDAKPGSSTA